MADYFDYYHRAIQNQPTGFKLVLGGTGLGKTSGIKTVVQAPEYREHKFIYCANRKQLLEEMAQSLDPSLYRVLRRDLEVVQRTLREQRSAFYDLLEEPVFLDNIRRANDLSKLGQIDLAAVRRACQALEELSDTGGFLPKLIEDQVEAQARLVLQAFRGALLAANNKQGETPAYKKLANHPVVQSLFPCIAFKRRPEVRLMLVTLQKAFYGFFDGYQTLNLTTLQDDDGGYVIFLDEFDFLENDLVGLICHSPQISNPFHFVERFYRAMKWHKLPLETYPLSEKIRGRIRSIITIIDGIRDEGLRFPEINQFTSALSRQASAIFRTRHTMITNPLFIQQTNRAFHLLDELNASSKDSTFAALHLFNAVSNACEQILLLFKELAREDPITHREMLRHCFQDTLFPEQMALVSQFSRPSDVQQTPLGDLLNTGYSVYDINDLQQRTDQDEVEVRHYSMYLTPEHILATLAQHNLVFGLSATADIPRCVHNFALDWLEQQEINIIPVDAVDEQIIHELNEKKAAARSNQVRVVPIGDLDAQDPFQRGLDEFLSGVATDEDFGQDTRSGHLKRRVQQFFTALLWVCEHAKEGDSLLLFLNTFRQIKLVFDRYPTPDEPWYAITKHTGNRWFDAYTIILLNRSFNVVFYNAQVANTVRPSQEAQDAFDALFWEHQPVVVVTQYRSAGNGVNLQYRPSRESLPQDFTHLGLLETPYFYFSKPEPDQPWDEKIAMLKENIWYQAKLFTSNIINEARFRQVLNTLHASKEWNQRYQNDPSTAPDALFNHMAAFMQALGRVERVWIKMEDQTILLSRDVYQHFQAFCAPEFSGLRERREPLISNNLRQVFDQVSASLPQIERALRQSKDARLLARNESCREAVHQLLRRLQGLRQGSGDREAREHWQELRRAVLRHDVGHDLLRKYACIAESPHYVNGLLYLTRDNDVIPAHLARLDTYTWRMDALYDVIGDNRVIRDYFLEHSYKLAFSRTSQQFFTPYCYQAVLAGATGEEAITALLQAEGVRLEEIDDALFEVADLKIADQPWYIDCKNYSERTLERFLLPTNDPAWHPKLNEEYFKEHALAKLGQISAYHRAPGKLIYLNLISGHERTLGLYNPDFRQVTSFADASIIVVQGALQRFAPNAYHQAFEYLLADLTKKES